MFHAALFPVVISVQERSRQTKTGEEEIGLKMKDDSPRLAENGLVDGRSYVDFETIIERIWVDLEGATSRSDIRKALMEVAPAYEGARIKTYVPIFLRRDVLRWFQSGLVQKRRSKEQEPENVASLKEADSAWEKTTESETRFSDR